MAIWHFRIGFVPKASILACYGNIPLILPQDQMIRENFWNDFKIPNEFEYLLENFGLEFTSWSDEIRCWGNEKGSHISVIYSANKIEWITSQADVREPCIDFLKKNINFATKLNCLLVASEVYLIEADFDKLYKCFRASVAAKYMNNPENALKSLPKRRDDKLR